MSSSLLVLLRLAALAGLVCAASACSITNIRADSCSDDAEGNAQCAAAFGLGSRCGGGFCSAATVCSSGHDCRAKHGGGACVDGTCKNALPPDPLGACTAFEPSNLASRALTGESAPIIVGGMFLFESDFSPPILDAARLAIREINGLGGVTGTRPLGMIFCDNGGPKNGLTGDARTARIQAVIDYLDGTLGAPFVVGPLTSGDSIFSIQRAIARKLPTVHISPSATSPALTVEPDRLAPSDPFGLFWRTAPSDQLQGAVLGKNVVGTFPKMETVKKVTVAYRDDAYGAGLADAFQKAFTNGTTTLIKFAVDADLKPVAAQVAATAPEALMFVDIGGERAVKFITSMSQTPAIAGLSLYLADGSKNEALLDDNLGDAIKNIIFNQTVGTVAAAPAGSDFNLFQSSYKSEFNGADPANSAFTANGYDALYVGAAGVVFASQNGNNYDGRQVAEGLSRLIMGKPTSVGKLGWGSIKSGLTTEPKTINIVGVSGALDFNPTVGEAAAPIEIWQPTKIAANCTNNKPPCFKRLTVISP